MFSWLFDSNFGGPVNYLIAHVTGQDLLWFTDTWPNRVVLTLNIVWFLLPFAMLVILAGLQSVNPEVLEAAKIDGAGPFRLHWNVIIPSVSGVIGFVILISLMDVLRVFDPLVALSHRRPRSATSRSCSTSTASPSKTAGSSSGWVVRSTSC